MVHVLSVSVVLHVPPLIASVLTVYVLVLVPVLDVALIPSQVAVQAVHSPQLPMQLTEQSVFWHVESISGTGQVLPLLLTGLVTLYVLVLVPVLGALVLIPSQVAAQEFHSPQSPTQSTGQSVLLHVLSVSIMLSVVGQVRPPLIAFVLTL
jgi:hypothetical protein